MCKNIGICSKMKLENSTAASESEVIGTKTSILVKYKQRDYLVTTDVHDIMI